MHLKKAYIDGYKNLIGTSIEVPPADIPLAIIGNNGSGKSNIIEALIQIFYCLFQGKPTPFNFKIEYEAHGKEVVAVNTPRDKQCRITVDGKIWDPLFFKKRIQDPEQMPPFPALVFCYYSGTCNREKKLIGYYNRSYLAKLKRQTDDLERLFVFSDVEQAGWCLLGLFAHHHYDLLKMLSLSGIEDIKISLKAPYDYSPETSDPSFWGTEGAIRYFIADLDYWAQRDFKTDSFSLTSKAPERVYYLDVKYLEMVGEALEKRKTNLFSMLQALAAEGMLKDVELKVIHTISGAKFSINDLSEGEKQLLCVIGGLKLSNQDECLVLLDEPDTHLNPAWSWEYESLLQNALKGMRRLSSTVLLATHDPVVISGLKKEQVLIAKYDEEDKKRLVYEQPLRDPRGQGVANVLTSEYFGLPSSLDKNTQELLDERLELAYKAELTEEQRQRLSTINQELGYLGLVISFRDPKDADIEKNKYGKV
jgi:ABC-type cobalamin/Fe3+-siderophores transport system ATPase subunit